MPATEWTLAAPRARSKREGSGHDFSVFDGAGRTRGRVCSTRWAHWDREFTRTELGCLGPKTPCRRDNCHERQICHTRSALLTDFVSVLDGPRSIPDFGIRPVVAGIGPEIRLETDQKLWGRRDADDPKTRDRLSAIAG
jgi:hypothetical protein